MTKYTPNIKDPRVQRKLEKAWNYSLANLSQTKPRNWATRRIDVWYGAQSNPLSRWLRDTLLITHNEYYNSLTGKTKSYLLSPTGIETLGQLLNKTNNKTPIQQQIKSARLAAADSVFGEEIKNAAFTYTEKSNRMWNDIQNLSNDVRKPLFANYGYVHEYDIKSCAPTLIKQYAVTCGLTRPTPVLDAYLADPEYHRQRIATLLGVDRKTAKKLITARFAGNKFGDNSILKDLGGSWLLHNRLKADEWYAVDLPKDIKKLWDIIKHTEHLPRMNGRVKWSVYFREEMRVMRATHQYLEKNNIKYFHEHDGWRCTSCVDLRALKLFIQKKTGYEVDFDYDVYEQ